MRNLILAIFFGFLLSSCNEQVKDQKSYFDIDALLNEQVKFLTTNKASLRKRAVIEGKEDEILMHPDSLKWAAEFEVFRYLDLINRPIYAEVYDVEEGIEDKQSNLKIRRMKARRDVPIREFNIYYLDHLDNIRKIEAKIEEQNSLYYSYRTMLIQFDTHQGQKYVNQSSVSGVQKMVLQDSVKFRIESKILID